MEVFVQNIDPSATVHSLKRIIAKVLHSPAFQPKKALPINFEVAIHRQTRAGQLRCGTLTLPTCDLGRRFLRAFQQNRKRSIACGSYCLTFSPGKRPPHPDILRKIMMLPYVDPQALEEREMILQELPARAVNVSTIQFGWECRDGSFSVEWEQQCAGRLELNLEEREFRVTFLSDTAVQHIIGIRGAQVISVTTGRDSASDSLAVFFSLQHPPSYTSSTSRSQANAQRQRWVALGEDHAKFAPYTSLAMCIVCPGWVASANIDWMVSHTHVRTAVRTLRVVRLGLFSAPLQEEYARFLAELQWLVAFQVDALARNHLLDLREVLNLRPHITYVLRRRGIKYTTALIRRFGIQAREPFWLQSSSDDAVRDLWLKCRQEFNPEEIGEEEEAMRQADTFPCLHATVTPTTIYLDGPFPERSNRIMRQFPKHTSNFLRVNFVDEGGLPYHMNRDIDDRLFIHRRFGGILSNGLDIAGRHFEFLAYSQSGLKQHAVWFMTPFVKSIDDYEIEITPDYIISSIGHFEGIDYDPQLIYCPARYGARISQAFTATEAAIAVEVDEIIILDDEYDAKGRSFTDGVGTVSPDLARYMWRTLQSISRRHAQNRHIEYAPALQIRCQGSKGMVSVDYELTGRQLCLRRSMIKFEAPHSWQAEIVTAFTSPGKFYLNRPLIMMLEDLQIEGGYGILKTLQDAVVTHTKDATRSLEHAATLFEKYGLGNAFKLTSVFLNLHKLGAGIQHSAFHLQLIDFAVHHVLRELKYHARIPVPEGWTLPGVADIHGYLEDGEIFACITSKEGNEPHYLEGPVMIFRSPVIHPGDIQVVRAIGKPPAGSPFAYEALANCVVFSIQGSRPLASCLAGGDLDGDVFVCSTLKDMLPTVTYEPAEYLPSERRVLTHPSTRQDIADFVTEFLYSDSIGIVATNWLLRVDQSEDGINDPDCLALAQLHSDAVDYPKTGNPVPIQNIPRLRSPIKPDWSQPELSFGNSSKVYYESQRWLGQLYREIKLPEPRMPKVLSTSGSHDVTLDRVLSHFRDNKLFNLQTYQTIKLVRNKVSTFISPWKYSKTHITEMWGFFHDFAADLRTICASYSISSNRSAMLTEEEAVVGTIVAKCASPRKRKDQIAQLREQTALLFDRIATQIAGRNLKEGEDIAAHAQLKLKRAWVAYGVSIIYRTAQYFGSRSFGIIALFEIFDAIKQLEAAAEAAAKQGENKL